MSWARIHDQHGMKSRHGSRPEQALQRSIIDYVRYAMSYNGRPLTDWLFHVPNGGKRSAIEAAIMKGLGVKAGVNDLVLPIMAGGYGGLWIELKVENRNLTDAQMAFHQRLREGGQCVATCRTLGEATQELSLYMLQAPGLFEHRAALTA